MPINAYETVFHLLDALNSAVRIAWTAKGSSAEAQSASIFTALLQQVRSHLVSVLELPQHGTGSSRISDLLTELDTQMADGSDQDSVFTLLEQLYKTTAEQAGRCVTAELLSQENCFARYLDLLKLAADQGAVVFIVSCATPCGQLTYELGEQLRSIGLDVNLYDKSCCSYCAVSSRIRGKSEQICMNAPVQMKGNLGRMPFSLRSVGSMPGYLHSCSIRLGQTEYAVRYRGLSIVVWDPVCNSLLDAVYFDPFSDLYAEGGFHKQKELDFIASHPEVTFITLQHPKMPGRNMDEHEARIYSTPDSYIETRVSQLTEFCGYTDDESEFQPLVHQPPSYIGVDGGRYFQDYHSKYLNCANGHRVTCHQPSQSKRTIYAIGGCATLGVALRDEDTCSSQLQELLNHAAPEQGFIVENYGFGHRNLLNEAAEIFAALERLPLKPGDIVVGIGDDIISYNPEIDVRPCRHGEIFLDRWHYTRDAHSLFAEGLYQTLSKHNFFTETLSIAPNISAKSHNIRAQLTPIQRDALAQYKANLSALWRSHTDHSGTTGAIVMNCNPFTLGHRYLIETAARQCSILIVFVVQEDKSLFSFSDRLRLVEEGTKDLNNVLVTGSGQFMISSMTFEGYFNKACLQDRLVDCSTDVTLFAEEIAPAAQIKVRFVGTEPTDQVTRQYNQALKNTLPRYGIRVEEIDRVTAAGEIISASTVRAMLKQGNWDAIRNLVPNSTLTYLKEHNFSSDRSV